MSVNRYSPPFPDLRVAISVIESALLPLLRAVSGSIGSPFPRWKRSVLSWNFGLLYTGAVLMTSEFSLMTALDGGNEKMYPHVLLKA